MCLTIETPVLGEIMDLRGQSTRQNVVLAQLIISVARLAFNRPDRNAIDPAEKIDLARFGNLRMPKGDELVALFSCDWFGRRNTGLAQTIHKQDFRRELCI